MSEKIVFQGKHVFDSLHKFWKLRFVCECKEEFDTLEELREHWVMDHNKENTQAWQNLSEELLVNIKESESGKEIGKDEEKIWDELVIINEWLNEDRIKCLSSGEKSYFRFLRDVFFDKPFAVIIKNRFPHLWNRLLGEAKEYQQKSINRVNDYAGFPPSNDI